jgi:RNase P subunit RPR2
LTDIPDLNQDSKDFTEDETRDAVVISRAEGMSEYLRDQICKECGQSMMSVQHQLRRYENKLYSRVTLECGQVHTIIVVIRADWLQETSDSNA